MQITHFRRKANSSDLLYFNVKGSTVFRIFEDRVEDVSKNERLANLTPIKVNSETHTLSSLATSETQQFSITCDEIKVVDSPTILKDLDEKVDVEWILTPIKRKLTELLKNNPEIIITDIDINYETVTSKKIKITI